MIAPPPGTKARVLLLEGISDSAVELLEADWGTITLVDEETGTARIEAGFNMPPGALGRQAGHRGDRQRQARGSEAGHPGEEVRDAGLHRLPRGR